MSVANAVRLLAVLLLVLGPAPARAVTEWGQTGEVGRVVLRSDSREDPGAGCVETTGPGELTPSVVETFAPKIYASRSGVQKVGYRLVLQRREANSPDARWRTVGVSLVLKREATRESAPDLDGGNMNVEDTTADYRLFHTVYWYGNRPRPIGVARYRVDWYRDGDTGAVRRFCAFRF